MQFLPRKKVHTQRVRTRGERLTILLVCLFSSSLYALDCKQIIKAIQRGRLPLHIFPSEMNPDQGFLEMPPFYSEDIPDVYTNLPRTRLLSLPEGVYDFLTSEFTSLTLFRNANHGMFFTGFKKGKRVIIRVPTLPSLAIDMVGGYLLMKKLERKGYAQFPKSDLLLTESGVPILIMEIFSSNASGYPSSTISKKLETNALGFGKNDERTIKTIKSLLQGAIAMDKEGVVHRDLKESNVLVNLNGDIQIIDFELASPSQHFKAQAEQGAYGTPGMMSPEQLQGKSASPRDDLFSLKILLWHVATGIEGPTQNPSAFMRIEDLARSRDGRERGYIAIQPAISADRANAKVPPAIAMIIGSQTISTAAELLRWVNLAAEKPQNVVLKEYSNFLLNYLRNNNPSTRGSRVRAIAKELVSNPLLNENLNLIGFTKHEWKDLDTAVNNLKIESERPVLKISSVSPKSLFEEYRTNRLNMH